MLHGKIGDEVVINTGGGSKFRSYISSISDDGKFNIFIPKQFRYGWDTPGFRMFSPVTGKADDLPQRGGMIVVSVTAGNITPSKNIEGAYIVFESRKPSNCP